MPIDGTLLTILVLLVFATVLALVQARRRDRCLKSLEGFHVTLAEKDGDLTWGRFEPYASGLEITYAAPVVAPQGHVERSFIFYKDQYETMDALYRYPEGLSEKEKERRAEIIHRTAHPGFWKRLWRKVRNWVSMVRDALVQSAGMIIGATKTKLPGATVLAGQEQQLKSLSGEVIGHAGNAFDPLLEKHLFRQVVLEVTLDGQTRSYCGWLKDYTSQFIEVVDAFANGTEAPLPLQSYAPAQANAEAAPADEAAGDGAVPKGVTLRVEAARLKIQNATGDVLSLQRLTAGGRTRPIGCVVPPGYTADLALPPGTEPEAVRAEIGSVERFDLVVPRAHAIVRHAADGSEGRAGSSSTAPILSQRASPATEDSKPAATDAPAAAHP